MDIVSSDWSNRHKELNKVIRKTEKLAIVIEMILDLHKELHTSDVSKTNNTNTIDTLWGDLQKNEFAIMPTAKDETIAWAIWHIARIEDLTMNILVNNSDQIFDKEWKKRMCIFISDTGNSMTDDEIMKFSKQVCIDELLKYRLAVGMKTREIIRNLKPEDMKRKISSVAIARILQEGGVLEHTDSIWLLDFWGKKDVAGIILMPLTRHQTLHLNDCYKWKQMIQNRNKFFAI
ncbi:MAG: DinB family protein [Lachnotalea sp.]